MNKFLLLILFLPGLCLAKIEEGSMVTVYCPNNGGAANIYDDVKLTDISANQQMIGLYRNKELRFGLNCQILEQ